MKWVSLSLLMLVAAVPAQAQTQVFTLLHANSYANAETACELHLVLNKAAETDAAHYTGLKLPVTVFNQAGKILEEETLVVEDWQVSNLAPIYDLRLALDAACSEPHMLKLGRVTAAVDGVNREISIHAAEFMPVIIK